MNSVGLGTFTTSHSLTNPYYTVTPAKVETSTFSTYKNTDTINFAVRPIANIKDYSVEVIPLNPARPGFPLNYQINYSNKGTTTLNNKKVEFIKDPRTQFVLAVPAYTSISGDTLRWNIVSLDPEDVGNILAVF